MKKFFLSSAILLVTVLLFNSCGKSCKGVDCPNLNIPVFMFRIVNSSNKDLLIGAAKTYDTTGVKISARNKQTGSVQTVTPNFAAIGDTVMYTTFAVNNSNSVYYLSINNVVKDSMFFTYKYFVDECCDRSYYYLGKFNSTDFGTSLTLPNIPAYFIVK